MKDPKQTAAKRRNAIFVLAAIVAVFAALAVLLWEPIVRYAKQPELLRAVAAQYPVRGRLLYIAIVFVQVVVAVIPGEPVEILGGYVFGAAEGTALFLLACAAASMLIFWLVRRFGVKLVRVFFTDEQLDKLHFLKTKKGREFFFFLIFAIPGTPKDLLSYFAGLTDIPFGLWLLICSVGRIPSVITSTFGGDALGTGEYGRAAVIFGVTIAVTVAGMLIYQGILKRHEKRKEHTESAPGESAPEPEKEETI